MNNPLNRSSSSSLLWPHLAQEIPGKVVREKNPEFYSEICISFFSSDKCLNTFWGWSLTIRCFQFSFDWIENILWVCNTLTPLKLIYELVKHFLKKSNIFCNLWQFYFTGDRWSTVSFKWKYRGTAFKDALIQIFFCIKQFEIWPHLSESFLRF